MDRRQFLKGALAGGGLLALSGPAAGARGAGSERKGVPSAVLGRTGVEVSRLGVGGWHFGTGRLGPGEIRDILHRAVELGVRYLDTAPNYGNSEESLGPVVKEVRDKVFLVTKTEEPSYEGTWRSLRRSLKHLQTDHLDLVHIHSVGNEQRFVNLADALGDKGALGALREAKKQGVIRFIGASGHNFPTRFHAVLETGEVDVLMNVVNYVAQHTYDFEHKVWCRARQENIGLVAMKVLGGSGRDGKGFRLPEDSYEQAVRYALSVPGVSSAVIGIKNLAELEKAAGTIAGFQPLSEEETLELYRRGVDLLSRDSSWRAAHGRPVT